jgi:hypothetical protein
MSMKSASIASEILLLLVLGLLIVLTNSVLLLVGEGEFGAFYSVSTIIFLLITWISRYLELNTTFRISLNIVSLLLFIGFVIIIAMKIITSLT